jgi:hypothetical protein
LSKEQIAFNRSLKTAMTDFINGDFAGDLGLPPEHIINHRRIVPRGRLFCSRKGICAVRVPVAPKELTDDGGAERAIFSMYDPAQAVDDDAGGVAAPKKKVRPVESNVDRFLVDFLFNYDIRGLSEIEPNAAAPDAPLTTAQVNDMRFAVDLAVGRRLEVQLCQPMWAFPWLNTFDEAKDFFKSKVNKWDADQWLVCNELF